MRMTLQALALAAATVMSMPCVAHADGLADLKGALGRMQAQTPVKATLDAKTWRKEGEGKDSDEYAGNAAITLEDGNAGLRLHYSRELMARMDADHQASARNPNAKTPALYALRELGPDDLRPLVSAGDSLARQLERATFKAEKAAAWQGKPARQLTFSLPVSSLSDRDRKYVKAFEGSFDVWIGADGVPLASSLNLHGSGRAFLVVSFEFHQEEQRTYALTGDRLLVTRQESKMSNAGAGERSESRVVKTLQVG